MATIAQRASVTLAQRLEKMSKDEMIVFASEEMGLQVDPNLEEDVIREKLLTIEAQQKSNARNINAGSLAMTMALVERRNASGKPKFKTVDPPLQARFYNNESPLADVEFSTTEPYGFRGEKNKYGFSKCPSWHLFHGEVYTLPASLIEHLKSLTYITAKPVIDPQTGMQHGTIPVVKNRFILEYMLTREQLALISAEAKPPGKVKNEA